MKRIISLLVASMLILSCSTTKPAQTIKPKIDPVIPGNYTAKDLPKFQKDISYENDVGKHSPMLHLRDKSGEFFCTGFVVDDHYAITAAHCIDDKIDSYINIYDVDNKPTGVKAKVGGFYSRLDQGIITADFSKFNKLKINTTEPKAMYAKLLITCGFPLGQKEVVCTPFLVKGHKDFYIAGVDNALYPGMSGGPGIDPDSGEVVALNSAVDDDLSFVSSLIGLLGAFGIEQP